MSSPGLESDDTSPTLEGLPAGGLRDTGGAGTPIVGVVDHAGRSRQGAARQRNQDRWGCTGSVTFVVADGMGGHSDGHVAASTAVGSVLEPTVDSWAERMDRANDAVRSCGTDGPRRAGTTLVALDVQDHRATIISAGDSRAYRLRGGQFESMTEDHNLRGELLTAGIDADEHTPARQSRGLTSFLGIDPDRLRVDIVDVALAAGDRFLLCSDGVHGTLEPHRLAASVSDGSCAEAVDTLFALLESADARDDATAVVVQIG